MDYITSSDKLVCFLQHSRFVQECKDAEPDVLFVGDSMIQLMQQYEVRQDIYLCKCPGVARSCDCPHRYSILILFFTKS